MVQGTSHINEPKVSAQDWNAKESRKAGYEALQKQQSKDEEAKKSKNYGSGSSKAGSSNSAWGNFGSRDAFVNRHNF